MKLAALSHLVSRGNMVAGVLTLALVGVSCGIEVGNPSTKKTGKQGKLTVALAESPGDGGSQVFFNITGLKIQGYDGSEFFLHPLELAVSGLVDMSTSAALLLAQEQSLPAGDYYALSLELSPELPGKVVEHDGREGPLLFASEAAAQSIIVAQDFSLEDGESQTVTIHLDWRKSINRRDDDGSPRFDFAPVGAMMRRDAIASVQGSLPVDAVSVCAYLVGRPPRPARSDHGPSIFDGERERHMRRPPLGPPPGVAMRMPPRAHERAPLVKDETSACANAFAHAQARDGAFVLAHLFPAIYELRVFKADGSYFDVVDRIETHPGQTVDLGAVVEPEG